MRRKESRKERGTGEVLAWSGFWRRGVTDSDLRRGHEAAGLRGSCMNVQNDAHEGARGGLACCRRRRPCALHRCRAAGSRGRTRPDAQGKGELLAQLVPCGAASMGVGCCCSCSMLETALQLEELLVRGVGGRFRTDRGEHEGGRGRSDRARRMWAKAGAPASWIERGSGAWVLPGTGHGSDGWLHLGIPR